MKPDLRSRNRKIRNRFRKPQNSSHTGISSSIIQSRLNVEKMAASSDDVVERIVASLANVQKALETKMTEFQTAIETKMTELQRDVAATNVKLDRIDMRTGFLVEHRVRKVAICSLSG